MQVVSINTAKRETLGRKATKASRKSGAIPSVLYGGNEVHHFTTTAKDVKSLVYTPDFKLAELDLDGQKHKAILKDIQFHPVTDEILHLDFLRLIDGVNVKVDVPVRYEGTSPGVKEGGKLMISLRNVTIKTKPEHLVDQLVADISEVKLGDSIRVKELQINENIEVMTDANIPVASVIVPRALKSADDQAAEDAAAAEGAEGAAEGAEGAPAADAPKEGA